MPVIARAIAEDPVKNRNVLGDLFALSLDKEESVRADIVRGLGDPASWPYVEHVAVHALTARGRAAVPASLLPGGRLGAGVAGMEVARIAAYFAPPTYEKLPPVSRAYEAILGRWPDEGVKGAPGRAANAVG